MDSLFLEAALNQARLAAKADEVPVGAVIVKDGQIIAEAYNTKLASKDVLGHAEINAIRIASSVIGDWRLSGCTLYTTLEPCPMCFGTILHARIDRVVYGALDRKWGACGSIVDLASMPLFNHFVTCDHLPHLECAEILTKFFRAKRSFRLQTSLLEQID